LSLLSGLNLRLEVLPSILLSGLSRRSSISSPLGVFNSVLGIPRRLINLPVIRDIHEFFPSLKDKKFNPGVFLGISKVLQGDVSLSGVLLISSVSVDLGVDVDA